MADIDAIIQALLSGNSDYELKNDGMYGAGQQMLNQQIDYSQMNPWAAAAFGLGKGLIGGGMESYGKSQATERAAEGQKMLMEALKSGDFGEITDKYPRLAQVKGMMDVAKVLDERAGAIDAAKQNVAQGRGRIDPSAAPSWYTPSEAGTGAAGGADLLKSLGGRSGEIQREAMKVSEAVLAGGGSLPEARQAANDYRDAAYRQEQEKEKRDLMLQSVYAKDVEGDVKQLTDASQKNAGIAATLRRSADVLGDTTGPYKGWWNEKKDNFLSLFGSDPEIEARQAARTELQNIALQKALENRQPGATANLEFQAYLKGTVGTDKPASYQRDYAERVANVAKYQDEEAKFMETMTTINKMSPAQARNLWNTYYSEYPPLVETSKGYEWNYNRPKWQDLFLSMQPEELVALSQGGSATGGDIEAEKAAVRARIAEKKARLSNARSGSW